ncbi:UvrB/UvrC motif-containing protein [Dethiothermospora halolimnae]|uniref:UvrB/UvrC motif-containing protein n=1 Tax=Dethiothermospora halolimnae TaxID=3114390 RepID=UPI003CCBEACC
MLCEDCGKNKATVHLTKVINGNVNKVHLCEDCASKNKDFNFDSSFSIHNFLTGLLEGSHNETVDFSKTKSIKCDTCGMTYGKFRQIGLFGCDDCYDNFKDKLKPLVKRIHGHNTHIGKVPKRAGGVIRVKKEIEKYRNQLNSAVKKEEFEKAVELRDKIKELEGQLDN